MDHASLFTKVVHAYLPKWCILIYRSGAFSITDFGALLFTDHIRFISTIYPPNSGYIRHFLFQLCNSCAIMVQLVQLWCNS
jgi:hypothetical protein